MDSHNIISQQAQQLANVTVFHGFIQGLPYLSNLRAIQTVI
jgi:hypothetical protein